MGRKEVAANANRGRKEVADDGRARTVDRRTFLRAAGAGAGATVTAGVTGATGQADDAAGSCESDDPVTETGHLAANEAHTFEYEVRSDDPCGVSLALTTDGDADFDLYATLDGRSPSPRDSDHSSTARSGDERIDLSAREVPQDGTIGILVKAYQGEGGFTLTVEEFDAVDFSDDDLVVVNTERRAIDTPTSEARYPGIYYPVSERPAKVELTARARERGEVGLTARGDVFPSALTDIAERDILWGGQTEYPESTTEVIEHPGEFVTWDLNYEVEWDFWRDLAGMPNEGTFELVIREYASEEPEESHAPELINREEREYDFEEERWWDAPGSASVRLGQYKSVVDDRTQIIVRAIPKKGMADIEGAKDDFVDLSKHKENVKYGIRVSHPSQTLLVFQDVEEFVHWAVIHTAGPLGVGTAGVSFVIEEYEYP